AIDEHALALTRGAGARIGTRGTVIGRTDKTAGRINCDVAGDVRITVKRPQGTAIENHSVGKSKQRAANRPGAALEMHLIGGTLIYRQGSRPDGTCRDGARCARSAQPASKYAAIDNRPAGVSASIHQRQCPRTSLDQFCGVRAIDDVGPYPPISRVAGIIVILGIGDIDKQFATGQTRSNRAGPCRAAGVVVEQPSADAAHDNAAAANSQRCTAADRKVGSLLQRVDGAADVNLGSGSL